MKKNFSFDQLSKVFIVAELSANHNGSLQVAIDTVKAAKKAGADAIKLQTYTADTITLNCNRKDFIINNGTIWDGITLYDLYASAFTPWDWHKKLFDVAKKENLICFSSPFDFSAVDFLEEIGNPIYKIASFEITDIPLIKYIATKNKPIIISTGVADIEDIELAIKTCKSQGNHQIALLKCTSSYPSKISDANLVMIRDLAKKFGVLTGLSDHTLGITSPILAVGFGAKIIEKHFILDKSIGGPDSSFSLDQKEFSKMVKSVREAELAIGQIDYGLNERQKKSRNFSRSLYVCKKIAKGDTFTKENIKSVRPGFSLHPKYYSKILGKRSKKNLSFGDRISIDFIE